MNFKYIIVSLIVAVLLILSLNYIELTAFQPKDIEKLSVNISSKENIINNETISILTWNIGYGGLGKESDFYIDGGKSILPKSREITLNHLNNITKFIHNYKSDIYLFQEVTLESKTTFNTNIFKKLQNTLQKYNSVYSPTVYIKNLTLIGNITSGNSMFSKYLPTTSKRISLPSDNNIIFNSKHNFIVQRYNIEGISKEWVIINVHLSAFDEGGKVRDEQINSIKEFMMNEYNKGNYVVVGGDWNHRLIETSFENNTDEKHLFWIKDLPSKFTPEGWKWGIDENEPTVRTLERPYVKNNNYTCIIDGFLVSPNVEIIETECINLEFEDSDHNPIVIEVRQKNSKFNKLLNIYDDTCISYKNSSQVLT